MGFMDTLNKIYSKAVTMSKELETCVSVVWMADLSDSELKECVDNTSKRAFLFLGTAAENINSMFKKMAVRQVAIDKGLIRDGE